MTHTGVTASWFFVEVSGCDSNVECNWRYKWIKLTLKVSERDENGGWMKGECSEDKSVWIMKRDEYSDDEGVYT